MNTQSIGNPNPSISAVPVYRIMHYIDTHLDEKLLLDDLSAMARYSPYHFHRMFKSIIGMTINAYVLERRMTQVKRYLEYHSNLSLTEIATRVGFASLSDFSRTFKVRFNETPTAYRMRIQADRKICIMDRKISERYFSMTYYNRVQENGRSAIEPIRSLKVTIIRMPQYRVIFYPLLGTGSEREVQDHLTQAFRKVFASAVSRYKHDFQTLMIGCSQELTILPLNGFRYRVDACATVPYTSEDDVDLAATHLPGGLYAKIRLSTRLEEKIDVLNAFYQEWLPDSGYTLGETPCLEIYGSAAAFQHGYPSYTDYCIPIIDTKD